MNVLGADPYVLFDERSGFYYCYATSNQDGDGQFYLYKSKDLIRWQFVRYALNIKDKNWGKGNYWAPECYFNPHNGHYYFFYSALVKDELKEEYFHDMTYEECAKIGVAVSASPEGPFINIEDRPIEYYPYDPGYYDVDRIFPDVFSSDATYERGLEAPRGTYLSAIDANLFIDGERMYLYYSRCCYRNCVYDPSLKKYIEESNILGVELENDWWFDPTASSMPKIKKEFIGYSEDKTRRQDGYRNIINYHSQPQEWENGHICDYEEKHLRNRRWAEGSTTFKYTVGGQEKYCITYSCNCYENALYGVGIAFGDEPLGQYKKFNQNPILHQMEPESLYSTGHGTVIEKDGQTYYFFHGRENMQSRRILYVGELHIDSLDNVRVENIVKCELMKEAIGIK